MCFLCLTNECLPAITSVPTYALAQSRCPQRNRTAPASTLSHQLLYLRSHRLQINSFVDCPQSRVLPLNLSWVAVRSVSSRCYRVTTLPPALMARHIACASPLENAALVCSIGRPSNAGHHRSSRAMLHLVVHKYPRVTSNHPTSSPFAPHVFVYSPSFMSICRCQLCHIIVVAVEIVVISCQLPSL